MLCTTMSLLHCNETRPHVLSASAILNDLQWPCARFKKCRFYHFPRFSFTDASLVLTIQLINSSFHVCLVCTVNKSVVFLLQYRSYRDAVLLEQAPQRSLIYGLIKVPHVNTIHSSRF